MQPRDDDSPQRRPCAMPPRDSPRRTRPTPSFAPAPSSARRHATDFSHSNRPVHRLLQHRLAQLPLQQRLHQQGEEVRRQQTLNPRHVLQEHRGHREVGLELGEPLFQQRLAFVRLEHLDAKTVKIAKASVDERKRSDVSLMPNGLAQGLSPQDFADLIAYLETLKNPK